MLSLLRTMRATIAAGAHDVSASGLADVVLVEDSPAVQSMVGVLIEKAGLTHTLAASLSDVQKLPLSNASCLLLLDMSLDRSDALQVVHHLADIGFAGPIVPMSGQEPAILRFVSELGRKRGLDVVEPLRKPFKVDALRVVLARHTGQGRGPVSIDWTSASSKGLVEARFEPRVYLSGFAPQGFEASLRVRDPEMGLLRPDRFLPSMNAEQRARVAAATYLEAVKGWERLSRLGLVLRPTIAVGALELAEPNFLEAVRSTLPSDPRWPGVLIKITDPEPIDGSERIRAAIVQLQLYKVTYGLASFEAVLQGVVKAAELKLAEVVVEARLTNGCDVDPERRKICTVAARLAKHMQVRLVAEGLETLKGIRTMQDLGFEQAQGPVFSAPMPLDVIEAMLRDREPLSPVYAAIC